MIAAIPSAELHNTMTCSLWLCATRCCPRHPASLLDLGAAGMQVGHIVEQEHCELQQLVQELLPVALDFINTSTAGASSGGPACAVQADAGAMGASSSDGQHAHVKQPSTQGCNQMEAALPAAITHEHQQADASRGSDLVLEPAAVLQGLCDYSLSIRQAVPSRDMAMKEFVWRNGFFLQHGRATPLHCDWLRRAGVLVTTGSDGKVQAVDEMSQLVLLCPA
jgi:hypothetical protein